MISFHVYIQNITFKVSTAKYINITYTTKTFFLLPKIPKQTYSSGKIKYKNLI